ncbi:MAG TPA: ATP-binding protein [Jatrophihabitans sp.]|nr:ATP-binding protein [Jatrophihabitans sp.]
MTQWRASADIPATVHGPRAARAFVAAMLDAWSLRALGYQAQLIASELVTNAYQHAPGTDSFELQLALDDGTHLRIALADGSAIKPTIAELDRERPAGRGLRIVQAVSAQWGTEEHQGGKRVWAELAVPASAKGPDQRVSSPPLHDGLQ